MATKTSTPDQGRPRSGSGGPFSLNYLLMGKLYNTKVVEPLVWLDVGNVKSGPGPQPGVR